MHVRVIRPRSGNKTYRYVQLVQSYRRPDGMPAHKVLANLGDLSAIATENLKKAVVAGRKGQAVLLPSEVQTRPALPKVKRNFAYLDVAAAYQIWRDWGLTGLLAELAPDSAEAVPFGEVVAALTVQRCVAPASKVEATRWYPKTALPELQGVKPRHFNNTRVHRVLNTLEGIEAPLQDALARRIEGRQGAFSCLFLDCTDTWFVGRGPELAVKRVTKERMLRKRIGIALLCNEDGLPIRWETVEGSHNEADTMFGLVASVSDLAWAQEATWVFDRRMGNESYLASLLSQDIRFVTAVPAHEIAARKDGLPLGAFDEVSLSPSEELQDGELKSLQQLASKLGFQRLSDRHYGLDLGVFSLSEASRRKAAAPNAPSRAEASLRLAETMAAELSSGVPLKELARNLGCSDQFVRRTRDLLSLDPQLQRRVRDGMADRLPVDALRTVARLPRAAQFVAFDGACKKAGEGAKLMPSRKLARLTGAAPLQVRGVLTFNPEQFHRQRRAAAEELAKLDNFLTNLNRRLRSPHSRRTEASVLGEMSAYLRKHKLLSAFKPRVTQTTLNSKAIWQAALDFDEPSWTRRRRTDGFMLLVAHPEVLLSGQQLVGLYFAKDKVEKDFQTIKGVLSLRPVHHRTDEKVRAHVTLCMLALLIERIVERRLANAGVPQTGQAALHELKDCHLNLFAGGSAFYSVTDPRPAQRALLEALGLTALVDDTQVAQSLIPR